MSLDRDTIPASVACAVCGKKQNVLKRCTRCHDAFYCCRECQVKDWPTHKLVCCGQQTSQKSNNYSTEPATNPSKEVPYCKAEELISLETHNQNTNHAEPSCCVFGNRKQLSCSMTKDRVTRSVQREASYNNRDSTHTSKSCNDSECQHIIKTSKTNVVDKKLDLAKTKTSDLPEIDTERPSLCIRVKANKKKYAIALQSDWSGDTMMKVISHHLRIPLDRLKLIRQGKQVTVETMAQVVMNKAMFQAIGEEAENEEGLEDSEIELVMKQAAASRNQAVRSLRKTGDVIDAIFDITNK